MNGKYSRTKKKSNSSKNESANYLNSLSGSKATSITSEKAENLWNTKDKADFVSRKLNVELDQWQKDYINAKGNTAVRAGRQSGKSFAQSIRTAIFALTYENENNLFEPTILITGGVERQAYELYMKVRRIIETIAPRSIRGKSTMTKMELDRCRILALPAGRDGAGLRGYATIRLVVDEAHYVHDDVYTAVEPMLATTGGDLDLLSTPRGNKGKFYEAFQKDAGFTIFHTTSEECPRIPKEWLEMQKRRMSKLQYAQEFLAEFLDSLQQFYPDSLIEGCVGDVRSVNEGRFYLGVDVARYGGDENAFVVVRTNRKRCEVVFVQTTERVSTVETMKRIKELNENYNFKKVYIDDGGIGGAVLDVLLTEPKLKRKVVGINNASRSIVADRTKGKRILKEDLHGNLRRLMEERTIKLPKDENMMNSLSSVQFEYTDNENFRIFGKYTHIAEAMVRACWAMVGKNLNIWIA